jgi:hypothetical protein
LVADFKVVGVPLIAQFVVLKVSPVSDVKLGDMLQDVTVPITEGVMAELRATPCVNIKGDPV